MEDENNKAKEILKPKLKNNFNRTKINTKHCCCCYCCSCCLCCLCCSSCCKKLRECSSKIPILVQFMILFIPITLIIALILSFIHLYFFSDIYKFDFYTIIKEEFLRYFITDLDDINFDLNQKRTSLLFEDISNLVFFKIYFDELNTYGILNEDKEKIFPNVSSLDEDMYKSLEISNTIFSIPKNMSEQYIDNRNDSFSELYKIYYYFLPLISTEANSAKTFINQTFLIAYDVTETKEIKSTVIFFNFPRITQDFFQNNNNFHPYNNLIAPRISGCQEYVMSEKINEEDRNNIYDTNWFMHFDCQFRKEPKSNFYLNFFHLNENNKGSINKTNIATMQTQLTNNKNNTFIINIIFFLNQKNLNNGDSEDSIFLVNNFTNNNIKRYSDYQSFVLNNNDITEIALSSHLSKYFHYGITSLNDILFSDGIFYDNIDINLLAEPSKSFSTIKGFNFDIRYFSSYYLFTKLFQKSEYSKEYIDTDNIFYYIFNNSLQIKEVCSKFDFNLYIKSLNENDVDCFDKKNLLYYTRNNIRTFLSEDLTLPYCICLPLYCIKNLENDFDINSIEFVDEIILPEKCQNNLLYFTNNIINNNDSKKDLSDISLKFGGSLEEHLESQYIKFDYEKKNLNGGLSFVYISIINNEEMKNILVEFVEEFNKSSLKIIIIFICGTFIIFIFFTILIMVYIISISNIIYEYKDKAYIFLNKSTNFSCTNKSQKTDSDNKNKTNYELFPLILEESAEIKNMEENDLINDLYKIYAKFYSENDNNNNIHSIRNRTLIKINKLKEGNELFKLFLKLSLYIPQFKLDINIDHDFYKDSKLIKNIENNFSKKLITGENKEQILYTKGIVKELLSTELIDDYGLITNLNFNYITNINIDKKNYIKNAIFKKVEEMQKSQISNKTENRNLNIDNIKIVFKNKNIIMKKLEEKFEQDDYLNLGKLDSYFNTTLINSFYNYTKRILTDK